MPTELTISEEIKGDVLSLTLKGRLDVLSTPKAEEKIFDFINSRHNKILLNFRNVDYISSAGMRMLLATTKKLRALQGQLVLCCVHENVMGIFRLSGFDHLLDICDSEEDAMKKFH